MYTERSRLLRSQHGSATSHIRAAVWQTKKWAKARTDAAELTRGNVAHVDIAEGVLQDVAGSCG